MDEDVSRNVNLYLLQLKIVLRKTVQAAICVRLDNKNVSFKPHLSLVIADIDSKSE